MATTRIKVEGPLFDGGAIQAATELSDTLAAEMAAVGATWIKVEAHGMDKSGRGGTGAAADGVKVTGSGAKYVISGGIRKGEYAWPWLEGTSQRNVGNKFKGYKTFRRTRLRMRKQAAPGAQAIVDQFVARMGGAA